MSLGVLLFNLGGPETLGDVRPFLYNLFSDPEIIRLPWRPLQKPLAWLIAATRHKKSAAYYAQIGGGSPLRRITQAQGAALRDELKRRGLQARVYVGMRYWHPFTREAVEQMLRDGITELVVLPLYPQFSISTTGSSLKEFIALARARGGLRHIRRHYITRWHTHHLYISALAEQIREELARFPDPDPRRVHLLFSAHSVPQRYIAEGDPYLRHTQQTVRLVSAALGETSPVHLSFQSKVGPVRWLEPSTEQKLRELRAAGADQVLAIPVSFVSDHIETLYELDILYKQVAEEIGISTYRRVPALNCAPGFIGALAELVSEKVKQSVVCVP
jgi:ferrochelatase